MTRTARRTFNGWRFASAVADVLRARRLLAATSVTESTARRHAETIAELEAKLASQVAKATFDAAQVADEEGAACGRGPGVGASCRCIRRRRRVRERQRAAERARADAGRRPAASLREQRRAGLRFASER